jgi:hypothetical protein
MPRHCGGMLITRSVVLALLRRQDWHTAKRSRCRAGSLSALRQRREQTAANGAVPKRDRTR